MIYDIQIMSITQQQNGMNYLLIHPKTQMNLKNVLGEGMIPFMWCSQKQPIVTESRFMVAWGWGAG